LEDLGTAVILLRLFKLWGLGWKEARIYICMLFAMLTAIMGMAFAGIVREETSVVLVSLNSFSVCSPTIDNASYLIDCYILTLITDIFAVCLFFLNALAKPRHESRKLIEVFVNDGLPFFLVSILSRSVSIYFMTLHRPSIFFAGYIISAQLISATSYRSLLNLLEGAHKDPECDASCNENFLLDNIELGLIRQHYESTTICS